MSTTWPAELPAIQLRIARPSAQLDRVVAFYRDGLGLPIIYSYEHDAGYDGVMFGLPDRQYNLEITHHEGDGPIPRPSPDALLVLYIPDRNAVDAAVARLRAMGYEQITARNPYWSARGVTIPDPDGWNVVLACSHGFGSEYE